MIIVLLPTIMWIAAIATLWFIVALATDLFRILVWTVELIAKIIVLVYFIGLHTIRLIYWKIAKPKVAEEWIEMHYNRRKGRWE